MSFETPLHKVQGLGAAHSGTRAFWRLRVSGALLAVLTLWFAFVALGFVGTASFSALSFFQQPFNAILMGAFVILASYHGALGMREVIEDYVHTPGPKIFLLVLNRVFATLVTAGSLVALCRIAL